MTRFARIAGLGLLSLLPCALGQATLNLSEDLVPLGIATQNMAPNQPTLDAGPLILAGVRYAQANGMTTVIADPGAYYVQTAPANTPCYVPLNVNNLILDLQGSDLYFPDLLNAGLCLFGTGDTLQNFTVDQLKRPFSQVTITSVNAAAGQVQFTVNPGWQPPSALNSLLTPEQGATPQATVFLFRDGQPWPFSDRMPVQQPLMDDALTFIAPSQDMVGQIRPGDVAVVLPVNNFTPSVNVDGPCNGCTLRNIRVYSGTEAQLFLRGGGMTIERLYFMPRPGTDMLMAGGGPAFVFTGPNNTFSLNRGIREGDSGFTLYFGHYAMVEAVIDSRTIQLSGGCAGGCNLGIVPPLPNGANVQLQQVSDGAILATAKIVSQGSITSTNGTFQLTVTLDQDLPAGLQGCFFDPIDPAQRGGNTIIERNAVLDKPFSIGIEFYGPMNSSLLANYVQRSAWSAIWVEGNTHTDGYASAPSPQNITVNDNVIDTAIQYLATGAESSLLGSIQASENSPPLLPTSASPLQNITIANNFIADSNRPAIWMGNTTGGSVSGNYILNPNLNPEPNLAPAALATEVLEPVVSDNSSGISIGNNTIDTTSGRMWVTDTQYNELAAYAPSSAYRLNAYNLGTLANPSITLTDGDGVVSPVTIQKTSTHALDVLIPASATLGGAYFTLTSGGAKYFATLFLDSQDNIPALNGCTYELSLSSGSAPSTASSLPVLVVTQAGCSYQALNTNTLAIVGATATGTGVLSVPLSANTGPAQTLALEVAGQQFTITQAAPTPAIQAVYDVWNYTQGVAPGAWVTIAGTALATGAPQTWTVTGSQLPTTLNGVTVTFNGLPATLEYVSSTQINALVPAGLMPAPVQVVVQNGASSSNPFTTIATATLPAIYALPNTAGSSFFVTAPLQATALLVGNSVVDSRALRAAEPGDVLDLYMIGLGVTADPTVFTTTQDFAGVYPVSANVTATIGGESAQVLFAGLTSPGLYLVRVVVPSDLKPGQAPIQISASGSMTSSQLFLTLQAAPQGNLVQNGDFELPLAGNLGSVAVSGNWGFTANASQGAAATTQETSSTAAVGNASLQVTVTSAATNTGNYCAVQLGQGGIPFKQGDVVSLQFWAKADAARPLWMNAVQNGGSYPSDGLSGSVQLGGSWQQYLIYFQSTATDPAGRLDFCMGDDAGNVWLDGVVLQDTSQ
jgi:uncharacterized protein (TIGR03437 family)